MGDPRRCWIIKSLETSKRRNYLLLKIDPPLIGQKYGLGSSDIDKVVVTTRYQGDSLMPVREWPIFVHVGRLLGKNLEDKNQLEDTDFEVIGWAELYRSEEEARQKAM